MTTSRTTVRTQANPPLGAEVGLGAQATDGFLRWLRQDPAFRSRSWLTALGAANLSILAGLTATPWLRAWSTETSVSLPYFLWAAGIWFGLAFFLASPACRSRGNEMALSLPLPTRKLWLAHLSAILVTGFVFLVFSCAFVAAGMALLAALMPTRPLAFEPGVPHLFVHLGTGLVLATAFLQGASPALRCVPFAGGYFSRWIVTLFGIPTLIVVLSSLPIYFALLPLGLAAVLGLRTYRSVPAAYSLAPLRPVEPGRTTVGASLAGQTYRSRPTAGIAYAWRLFSLLWRESPKRIPYIMPTLGFPLLVLFGAILSGILEVWLEPDAVELRLPAIFMTWYMLIVSLWLPPRNLHTTDSLPISRRLLFGVVVLPPMLCLVLGYGAGRLGVGLLEQPASLVSYHATEADPHHYVFVPYSACEIAWDGMAPGNSSPWGESHPVASTSPLYVGSRAVLYSPFSTPQGSSTEFVALQISRAVEAIYATSIPPEEIGERYLETDENGEVVLKTEGLTLVEDYPDLRAVENPSRTPLLLFAAGFPWLLLLAGWLPLVRVSVSELRQKITFWIVAGLCLALYLGSFAVSMLRFMTPAVTNGFLEILMRHLTNAVPGGATSIWAACALLLVGGYWMAQEQFVKIEPLPCRTST